MLDKPKREPKLYVSPEQQVAVDVHRYVETRISRARWLALQAQERATAWEKMGSDLLRKWPLPTEYDSYPRAVNPCD
jgi:hypothetical protein